MRHARRIGLALTTLALAGSGLPAPGDGDPVTEAKSQRAAALGITEGDLPPVPKGIAEPPPLPPPEIHPKDLRRSVRRGGKKAVNKKDSAKAPKARKRAGRKK
jgi:hypothetical protein